MSTRLFARVLSSGVTLCAVLCARALAAVVAAGVANAAANTAPNAAASLAVAAVAAPLSSHSQPPATVRVATWNVRNYMASDRHYDGRYRRDYPKPEAEKAALQQILLAVRPDVLVLQEIGSAAYLRELQADLKRLGLDYPFAAMPSLPADAPGSASAAEPAAESAESAESAATVATAEPAAVEADGAPHVVPHSDLAQQPTGAERSVAVLSRIRWVALETPQITFSYFGKRRAPVRPVLEIVFEAGAAHAAETGVDSIVRADIAAPSAAATASASAATATVPAATPVAPVAAAAPLSAASTPASAGWRWSVFTLHLKSRYTTDKQDPEGRILRTAEATAIRNHLFKRYPPQQKYPYLIAGDFNDLQDSAPIRRFLVRGEHTLAHAVTCADSRGELWTYYYAKEATYQRIDYILASPGMYPQVQEGHIADALPQARLASDHRLVYVDVHLPSRLVGAGPQR